MVLDGGGDDRLVVNRGVEPAVLDILGHRLPVLVAPILHARHLLDPFGVVGAEQGAAAVALEVRELVGSLSGSPFFTTSHSE